MKILWTILAAIIVRSYEISVYYYICGLMSDRCEDHILAAIIVRSYEISVCWYVACCVPIDRRANMWLKFILVIKVVLITSPLIDNHFFSSKKGLPPPRFFSKWFFCFSIFFTSSPSFVPHFKNLLSFRWSSYFIQGPPFWIIFLSSVLVCRS